MTDGQLHIDITDEASLLGAADYLHDGEFPPEGAQYDAAARTFTLTMWREILGPRVRTRIPFIRRRAISWARCRLVLMQVTGATIRPILGRGNKDGLWSVFCDVAYRAEPPEIQIYDCIGALKIVLQVSGIDGYLEDTGEVTSDPDRWRPE